MNTNSILFKISLFFIVAFFAMTLLFKMMYDYEFTSVKENLKVHYHGIAKYVMLWHIGQNSHTELMQNLKNSRMEVVSSEDLYAKVMQEKKFETISCGMENFNLYEKDGYRYMLTPQNTGGMLLRDVEAKPIDVHYMWWLYGAFVLVLFALFLSIAISMYPLKHLQMQIRRFGEGDMEIDLASKGKDEIAEVSNEFDKAVKKIKEMISARAIFIRNITHELKTPIMKGQLSLEFLEESRTKQILSHAFLRLNLLTKEFVQIENITTCECNAEKKSYHITDILDNAVDLLFLENGCVKNNLDNRTVEVDFELMSIVFKNLIDNGIKYSDDAEVFLDLQGDKLAFCSRGKKLTHALEYYIQPFTKCDTNLNESFGLGLYIVNYILSKHNLLLTYEHKEEINRFIVLLKS